MTQVSARAYGSALGSVCETCGAARGDHCTYIDVLGVTRVRRIPCLTRIQPLDVELTDVADQPADFSEPRHPRNDA